MAGKKKGRDVSALQIVDNARFVHPGCGVNALSDLQKRKNSIYCRVHVGLISIEHQAILRCHHRGRDVSSPIMKINYAFFSTICVSGRFRKA